MVLHLRAPKGKVSVEVMLNRAKYFDRTGKVNDHTIYLSGNLGKNALEFAMCLSAKATGGRVYTMGHTLVIEEADEAVLYFGADSTFRSAKEEVAAWEPRVQDVLARKICPAFSAYVKTIRRWRKKKLLLPAAGDSNARNSGRDNQAFPDKNWFLKMRLRRRCGISVANGIDSIGNLGKSSVQRRKLFPRRK